MDRKRALIGLGFLSILALIVTLVLVLRNNTSNSPPNNPPLNLICSGNGTMGDNGVCQCSPGFMGKDCSVGMYYLTAPLQPPATRYVIYDPSASPYVSFLGPKGRGMLLSIGFRQSKTSKNLNMLYSDPITGTTKYLASSSPKTSYYLKDLIHGATDDSSKAVEFALVPAPQGQGGGYHLQYLGAPDSIFLGFPYINDDVDFWPLDISKEMQRLVVALEPNSTVPRACSGNGKLGSGVCSCYPMFTGSDCAFDLTGNYYLIFPSESTPATRYLNYDVGPGGLGTYKGPKGAKALIVSFGQNGKGEITISCGVDPITKKKTYLSPGQADAGNPPSAYYLTRQIAAAVTDSSKASGFLLLRRNGGYLLGGTWGNGIFLGTPFRNIDVDFIDPSDTGISCKDPTCQVLMDFEPI